MKKIEYKHFGITKYILDDGSFKYFKGRVRIQGLDETVGKLLDEIVKSISVI